VLGIRSSDPVVSLVGSLGLGAAAGTALVIDFADQAAPGGRTLAHLLEEGPRLDELSPGRPGVAVIRAGGVDVHDTEQVIERLSRHWPALVLRSSPTETSWPVVPVVPLYPGWLAPIDSGPSVWQSLGPLSRPPGPGPVLPPLRTAQVRWVLGGGLPSKGRWLSVWERVWELPWA
jgi:hypothetical protein